MAPRQPRATVQERPAPRHIDPRSMQINAPSLTTLEVQRRPEGDDRQGRISGARVPEPSPASIEGLVEQAVERAVIRLLGPYLAQLAGPRPLVYTVAQASAVLQVSPDTVARLVKRSLLPRVPHVEGKLLIPRKALDEFIAGVQTSVDDGETVQPA